MRSRANKGFTLIELLVIVTILTVVLNIATPSFRKYRRNTDLKTAARAMAADFSKLKHLAMSEGVHYKAVLSVENNSYKILKGEHIGAAVQYAEESAIIKTLGSFGEDIIISSDPAPTYQNSQIIFQPRGTTSAGRIVLENSFGSKARITSNITGRVYISFDMK